VLLLPKAIVPWVFAVEGLTIRVTAALKPAELDPPLPLPPPPLLLPPPHAARARAAAAPAAASPVILRLGII
jgi:hypothetical protein